MHRFYRHESAPCPWISVVCEPIVSEIALMHVVTQWERRGVQDTIAHTGMIGIKTDLLGFGFDGEGYPNPEQVLRLIQELRDRHQAVATTKARIMH